MTRPDLKALNRRLSLGKLEFLCLVVQLGSMKLITEALGITQTNVNSRLRSLERQCGVTLFVLGEPTIRLTEEGRRVHEWAAETLARGRSLIRELQSLEESGQGAILIAATVSVGTYLLPTTLTAFLQRRPRVQITVTTGDPASALRDVKRGYADFGVIASDSLPDDAELLSVPLGKEELVLVAANDGRPPPDAIPLASLRDLRLIGPPSGSAIRDVLDAFVALHGTSFRRSNLGLEHPEAIKQAVLANMGVAMATRGAVEAELGKGLLREIRFTDARLSYPLFAVRRADKRLSAVQRELFDVVCHDVLHRHGQYDGDTSRG